MLPYNVPNDRILGPSAERIQNKQQQVAGLTDGGRFEWPLTLL